MRVVRTAGQRALCLGKLHRSRLVVGDGDSDKSRVSNEWGVWANSIVTNPRKSEVFFFFFGQVEIGAKL